MRSKGAYVEEFPTVLRSYCTTSRSSTGETPFSLIYGTKAFLPLEILEGSLWVTDFKENDNEVERHQDLDTLNEEHEAAKLCQAAYKACTKNYHNMRVQMKNFNVGEWVLRKNESSHAQPQGKLSVTWEGPYKIVETHQNGAYVIEAQDGRPIPRTWNAQNLCQFYS